MNPLDLVNELRKAFADRDADRLAGLLHPDVELRLVSAEGPIVGRAAAREWYRRSFETRLRFGAEARAELRDDGSVFMRGRLNWFGPGGGSDRDGAWLITFRDGLVASIVSADSTG